MKLQRHLTDKIMNLVKKLVGLQTGPYNSFPRKALKDEDSASAAKTMSEVKELS